MLQQPIAVPSITNFHLKIFAASLMVVDHLGIALDLEPLRLIGRLSFPMFAWLVCKGFENTKDFNRYQWRLLALAIVSQPILMAFKVHFDYQGLLIFNPVFTLWLGLHAINAFRQEKIVRLSIIAIASVFCAYNIYGILIVLLFATVPIPEGKRDNPKAIRFASARLWAIAWIGAHLFYAVLSPVQLWAIPFAGLVPFLTAVRDRGPHARWFYAFYPLHFLALMLIPG